MHRRVCAAAVAAILPAPLLAQTQQVRPPIAVYWISAETAGGANMGLPPGMGGFMPAAMQGGKRLKLELGSSLQASEPQAAHAIPPGLAMGDKLPLLSPRLERERAPARESDEEPQYQHPKGRMLIYWGCGETVRAGQPVIIDFATLDPQQAAKAFRSIAIARARGPAPGRNRSYGDWPNQQDARPVPAAASLQGAHAVSGNYTPEIHFSVDAQHDFMDAVAFDPVRKTAAGAYALKWKAIPHATGYFASAIGTGEDRNEVIAWSSSEVQVMGQTLMDYIAPAEAARLVREQVVLSPQTTECMVPGVFKTQGSMLNFIAYGGELNLVQPPRPKDPKLPWEQEWAVKLRLKSTAMTLLAEHEGGARPSRSDEPAAAPQPNAPPAQAPSPPDAVQEGVKALRGILRF